MKRIHFLSILLAMTTVAAMNQHMRKPTVTLDDEDLNRCLAVLESAKYEITSNVELREETKRLFSELVKRGGRKLGDECVKVLVNDSSNSDSIRKAQLVLAQQDLTDNQLKLLNMKGREDLVIWSYTRLKKAQRDYDMPEEGAFPGIRVEYLSAIFDIRLSPSGSKQNGNAIMYKYRTGMPTRIGLF